jgi:hypothetical protein
MPYCHPRLKYQPLLTQFSAAICSMPLRLISWKLRPPVIWYEIPSIANTPKFIVVSSFGWHYAWRKLAGIMNFRIPLKHALCEPERPNFGALLAYLRML